MKHLLIFSTFVLLFFCFSNGLSAQFENYPTNKKLVQIPTIPHNQPIEVFYLNENPDSSYIKIALLEASRGTSESYATIIADLKIQAQEEGVDAIMIFQIQTATRSYRDIDNFLNSYPVKEVLAYGIKYVSTSNFDYLNSIPKVERCYIYNDSSKTFKDEYFRKFDAMGNLIASNCKQSFNNFLYQYSLHHLVSERTNWTYAPTAKGNFISKRQCTTTEGQKECSFDYDSLQRLSKITIKTDIRKDGYRKIETQYVTLTYNEDGYLHQKDIFPTIKDESFFYREIFKYDALGRIKEKVIFKYSNGDRIPIAKCFYTEFYTIVDYLEDTQ